MYKWNHPEAIEIIKGYLSSGRRDLTLLELQLRPFVSPTRAIPLPTLCQHLQKSSTQALVKQPHKDTRKRAAASMSESEYPTDDQEIVCLLGNDTRRQERDTVCLCFTYN